MIELPVIYSQGFNKRMKISIIFTPPLMVEGENEILQFLAYKPINEKMITQDMNSILNAKDFMVRKIVNISGKKISFHSTLYHSEYLVKFKVKSLFKNALKNIKKLPESQYEEMKYLTIKIILFQDNSITKFMQILCNDKFPDLWNKIEWIRRNKMY